MNILNSQLYSIRPNLISFLLFFNRFSSFAKLLATTVFSYVQLVGNLNEHLQSFKHSALYKSSEKELLLYQIKIPSNGDSLFLSFSLRVTESLEVDVWLNGIRLISSDLGWLQMQDNKISHWSQLENLLVRLHNAEKEAECFEMSDKSLIEHANVFISKVTTDANKELCSFLSEQLLLSIENSDRRRFSSNATVAAYALNMQSARAYEYVRNNLLVLPSSRHLRQISSNISADVSAESNEYLKTKTKYLKPQELYVNVQLDEIHIRPCVTFKNGRLTGTNEEGETATSIHCFLISSLL